MPSAVAAAAGTVLQALPLAEALPQAPPAPMWRLMLDAALFGICGIVLLIVGYYLWELITPYNLRREIHENRNIAVAIVVAAFILGMAIIIAAALFLIK
jgi:putative membrane protein